MQPRDAVAVLTEPKALHAANPDACTADLGVRKCCSGGVWTEAMLTNPLGEQAFVEGMTMHVVAVAQLIEEALPHLTKSGVRFGCFAVFCAENCSSNGTEGPAAPEQERGAVLLLPYPYLCAETCSRSAAGCRRNRPQNAVLHSAATGEVQ